MYLLTAFTSIYFYVQFLSVLLYWKWVMKSPLPAVFLFLFYYSYFYYSRISSYAYRFLYFFLFCIIIEDIHKNEINCLFLVIQRLVNIIYLKIWHPKKKSEATKKCFFLILFLHQLLSLKECKCMYTIGNNFI